MNWIREKRKGSFRVYNKETKILKDRSANEYHELNERNIDSPTIANENVYDTIGTCSQYEIVSLERDEGGARCKMRESMKIAVSPSNSILDRHLASSLHDIKEKRGLLASESYDALIKLQRDSTDRAASCSRDESLDERVDKECREFVRYSQPSEDDIIVLLNRLARKDKDVVDAGDLDRLNARSEVKLDFENSMLTPAEQKSFLSNRNRRRDAIQCEDSDGLLQFVRLYNIGKTLTACKLL